jgi:hypothetical protein
MECDSVYKIGRSDMEHIDDLMAQYSSRYMPKKKLVKYWHVQNSVIVEELIFDQLYLDDSIQHVEGEWYKGSIDEILHIIENVQVQMANDGFIWNEWPLSLVSDKRLQSLMKDESIHNPWPEYHPRWRESSIQLLLLVKSVHDMYMCNIPQDELVIDILMDEFGELGIDRSIILPFLYVHTNSDVDLAIEALGLYPMGQKDAIKALKERTLLYLGYLTKVSKSGLGSKLGNMNISNLRKDEMIESIRYPTHRDEIIFRANIRRVLPSVRKHLKFG